MGTSPPDAPGVQPPSHKPISPKMLFSDLYKASRSPLSRLRHSNPQPLPADLGADYDADMLSKDKARQKEAVKRYLTERVRNDWDFTWPPAASTPPKEEPPQATSPPASSVEADPRTGLDEAAPAPSATEKPAESDNRLTSANLETKNALEDATEQRPSGDADSETVSIYSTVSEDTLHFRSRAEWTSDLSDDNEGLVADSSPFRFDSPDAVGAAVQASAAAREDRRRRAARKEAMWNPGLACFLARRDAWTGARTVRVKPKPASPVTPTSGRRLFWRSHHHSKSTASANGDTTADGALQSPPISPTSTHDILPQRSRQDGSPLSSEDSRAAHPPPAAKYPVETLLPLPPAILPAANPMRASISPALYLSLYDKIVMHSMQPSCPINLGDMTRACVAGWKRDGEWPPRPIDPPAVIAVRRKKPQQQQQQKDHVRRSSVATSASGGRRLSFGFLGRVGSGGGGDRDDKDREKEKEKEKDAREKDSDDSPVSGKVRRSLQRVLGLGGHGSPRDAAPVSPTDNKEAAGAMAFGVSEKNGDGNGHNKELRV